MVLFTGHETRSYRKALGERRSSTDERKGHDLTDETSFTIVFHISNWVLIWKTRLVPLRDVFCLCPSTTVSWSRRIRYSFSVSFICGAFVCNWFSLVVQINFQDGRNIDFEDGVKVVHNINRSRSSDKAITSWRWLKLSWFLQEGFSVCHRSLIMHGQRYKGEPSWYDHPIFWCSPMSFRKFPGRDLRVDTEGGDLVQLAISSGPSSTNLQTLFKILNLQIRRKFCQEFFGNTNTRSWVLALNHPSWILDIRSWVLGRGKDRSSQETKLNFNILKIFPKNITPVSYAIRFEFGILNLYMSCEQTFAILPPLASLAISRWFHIVTIAVILWHSHNHHRCYSHCHHPDSCDN